MFDRDKRLILSNRRYAEMYRISRDKVKPRMSVDEILRQRFDASNAPVEGMNVFVEKASASSQRTRPARSTWR